MTEALSRSELTELLNRPEVLQHLAAGAQGTVGVTVEYRVEPEGEAWWWSTRDEKVATGVGRALDPDVVLLCDAPTARRLISGTLEVSRAFLLGDLRVEGDLGAALSRVTGDRPEPRPAQTGQD